MCTNYITTIKSANDRAKQSLTLKITYSVEVILTAFYQKNINSKKNAQETFCLSLGKKWNDAAASLQFYSKFEQNVSCVLLLLVLFCFNVPCYKFTVHLDQYLIFNHWKNCR